MEYQLAQLNIAKFLLPQADPANKGFVDNLDRVNAIAEAQPGFVWRLTGDGNDALDIKAFDDPNIASNMSVWKNLESLAAFVYRNKQHREIMRRRKEWFENIEFMLVLWWVEKGHRPTLEEAKQRLEHLVEHGATHYSFTFKQPFAAPMGEPTQPILDECA